MDPQHQHHLGTQKCRLLGPTPDLLHQNLADQNLAVHVHKISLQWSDINISEMLIRWRGTLGTRYRVGLLKRPLHGCLVEAKLFCLSFSQQPSPAFIHVCLLACISAGNSVFRMSMKRACRDACCSVLVLRGDLWHEKRKEKSSKDVKIILPNGSTGKVTFHQVVVMLKLINVTYLLNP